MKVIKGGTGDIDKINADKVKLRQREESQKRLELLAKEQKHAHSTVVSLEKTLALLLETVANQEERIFALENSLKN